MCDTEVWRGSGAHSAVRPECWQRAELLAGSETRVWRCGTCFAFGHDVWSSSSYACDQNVPR